MQEQLFKAKEVGQLVEELQPPVGALDTIEEILQKFQNEESIQSIARDNPLGEMELLDEDIEAQNQAENGSGSEFGDNREYYEV